MASNCKIYCFLLVAVTLYGFAAAQNDASVSNPEEIFKNNEDKFNKTLDQANGELKKKCQDNAGTGWEQAYNRSVKAQTTLKNCTTDYIAIDSLKSKMQAARGEGKLDEVFKDYCERKHVPQNCLKEFTKTLEPCLNGSEKSNLNMVHNVTNQLTTFICHKDGDRIALFIAEKGPECLQNNTEAIQKCVKDIKPGSENITDLANMDVANIAALNLQLDNDQLCKEMDQVKNCVVNALLTCSEPTPSNIADSLFKFVRKTLCSGVPETPLGKTASPSSQPNTSGSASVILAISAVMAAIAYF